MGIFSSFEKNLTHGGVKIEMQAPASVSMQDANVPVSVTVTAGGSPVHINGARAQIFAESQNRNFNQGSQNPASTSPNMGPKSVALADNDQPFDLAPGQSQAVQLNIVMNAGAAIAAQLPEGSTAAGIVHDLQQLQSLGEAMNSQSYTYYVQASVDVEGIALDPSKRQPIQIIKPGQVGTGFNINL